MKFYSKPFFSSFYAAVFFIVLFSFSNIYSQSSWSEQNSGVTYELTSVSAPDNLNAWACGFGRTILRTTNAGVLWSSAAGTGIPIYMNLYTIFGITGSTALAAGKESTSEAAFVYRTSNSGASWTQVFTLNSGFINAIKMTDANNGFMVCDPVNNYWSNWRTTDGGKTWSAAGSLLALSGSYGFTNCLCVLGTHVWFGTAQTHSWIYHSSDNGTSWTAQVATGVTDIYGVFFNSITKGLAGGNSGLVRTTDGGNNWNSFSTTGLFAITGDMNNTYWDVGSSFVRISTDNGNTWMLDHTLTGGAYRDITCSRAGTPPNVWAVGTPGKISYFGPTSGITPVNNSAVTDYKLSQNFPNPFNPETKINFSLPHAGFTTLRVYSMDGRQVLSPVSEILNAGNYSISFNGSELPSGVYFYELRSGNYTETKKMMLVK